jgi:Protein of unknown function (DUF3750)
LISISALLVTSFVFLVVAPVSLSAALYALDDRVMDWRLADRSSAGLLPRADGHHDAVVRIFSARTVRWRGIVATHSWIVIKETGASAYTRFDYTAWGEPIWIDRFAPDGRWFGREPELIYAADGPAAEAMLPKIRETVRSYPFSRPGDYRAWPGPNSNTFVAAVMSAMPGITATLPPTAIGKDFPFDNRWIGLTPSRTGVRCSLAGYIGLTCAWIEGVEINLLGAVVGLDVRRPAIKLPGLGRLGIQSHRTAAEARIL